MNVYIQRVTIFIYFSKWNYDEIKLDIYVYWTDYQYAKRYAIYLDIHDNIFCSRQFPVRKYKFEKWWGQIRKYFVPVRSRTAECNLAKKQTWICNHHSNDKVIKRSIDDVIHHRDNNVDNNFCYCNVGLFSLIVSFVIVNNL